MLLGVLAIVNPLSAEEAGLVAHFTFQEGEGQILKDHSGNGNDGQIHGAKWVKGYGGKGALSFRDGAYVDLGAKPDLNPSGDRAIVAWVELQAPSYPGVGTNWTILDGGDEYQQTGYMLRIDGDSTKASYRHSANGAATDIFGRAGIENNTYYHVAVTCSGNTAAVYIDGILDVQSPVCASAPTKRPITISHPVQSFAGLIEDLAIYRRALGAGEIVKAYQQGAAVRGKDASWIGKIKLNLYSHYGQGSLLAAANLAGVLPLDADQQASLELGRAGQKPIQVEIVKTMPDTGRYECTFPIKDLPEGKYQIAAMVRDADGKVTSQSVATFAVPYEPVTAAAPNEKIVPLLPKPAAPADYQFELGAGGGFTIQVGADQYPVESAFSWPNGDFNLLSATPPVKGQCEPDWKATTRKTDESTYQVSASGKFYTIERTIRLRPTHVNVQDKITNKTAQAVGILLRNTIDTTGRGIIAGRLGGMETKQSKANSEIKSNPTVFLRKPGLGLGLVALDDVFIVQAKADFNFDRSALGSTQFALDQGASYTLEWSLYLNSTGDYYDFINQVRKDEKRNGKVEGGLALYYDRSFKRRGIPTREYADLRNIKYLNLNGLEFPADDPDISLNGIEFLQGYPKEMALMKEQIAAIQKMHPGMQVMFHVAHSLYNTNKPEQTFPDSRVLNADGKQATYDQGSVQRYTSKERMAQGWNWWIYYPSLDNSYGKELLRSVDYMVDVLGCKGVFMDGFMWAYSGEYTYDRWDGHTVEIDPATKTITRKVGSVLLLSQDAMVAFSRKMRDKDGQVVANNSIITRTIGKETYIIYDAELQEGPWTHLAPSVTTLSHSARFTNEKEFYYDALNKLKWGSLTFYYGDYPNAGKDFFTRPPIVARMYPITFEEIHSYYVKGQERLITAKPGVYGWRGDRDLHMAYRYDAQGWEIPADYLTTVDGDSVRTDVTLAPREAAVIRKVPVRLKASSPVNVVFRQYDGQGVALGLNGQGEARLTVADGEFAIKPAAAYLVRTATETRATADSQGVLTFTCQLNGATEMSVRACP